MELKGSLFNEKEMVNELRAELNVGQKERFSLNTHNTMLQDELLKMQKDNSDLSKQLKVGIQKHTFK